MPAEGYPRDEHATRPQPEGTDPDGDEPGRWLAQLDRDQAMRLLASVDFGRVVFTLHALPAIRPVNHLIDDDEIIIRTQLSTKIAAVIDQPADIVVAYQADALDPVRRLGWCVVVTGIARPITDPERIARYERRLRPWVNRVMDMVIGIRPEIVTGFRLIAPS